jgi:hypothetical protein
MPKIELEPLDSKNYVGVLGITFPFERTQFGAVHILLEGKLVERLGLPSLENLTISNRETYRLNGVWGPTVSSCDRLFAVNSGAFLAIASKLGTGKSLSVEIKPIYGIFVPAGYAVGLQTIYNNRSSHLVITSRLAKITNLPIDLPEFSSNWHGTDSDPTMHEIDPLYNPPTR